jgi:hypothetical protein
MDIASGLRIGPFEVLNPLQPAVSRARRYGEHYCPGRLIVVEVRTVEAKYPAPARTRFAEDFSGASGEWSGSAPRCAARKTVGADTELARWRLIFGSQHSNRTTSQR